ncbi:efflux RND transporter periplasmic adaptor subunit [Lewinella cohaerens]|uniref:efflux RND transporter periplasmic adaptor subunit n=1 Tax=Lewinella cohaerens TaxID=70995 RepID=UPI00036E058A|nr:efflux RND transporter periplasmic adaptor subunit [Lewinella cohaerens]
MKFFIPFMMLALIFASCQAEAPEGELPASLDEKKTLLREKRIALKGLSDEIKTLEDAIAAQDPDSQDAGVLVATTKVAKSDFASYVVLQGSVTAEDLTDATAEIGGRILQLEAKEGQTVRRGQLIAVLDVEGYQKQREELETTLSLAIDVFERQKRLWDQNIGSEIQFLQAKNNKERLEKSLGTLDLQLSKNKVYAPISGVVERVVLQSGELAGPGVPIIQILNTSELKLAADVPENYIRSVSRGEKVEVAVPALGIERTLPVSLIGKTVDPANRTFKVEVKLPANPDLKPNLLAEMKIKEFVAEDVVTISMDWVQQEVGGKRFVFVLDENEDGAMIASKHYVKIGESYDGSVIITEGLVGGEQLITEGSRDLTDGQLIKINQPANNG